MSEKRLSTSPNAIQAKNQWKAISIGEIPDVRSWQEKGEQTVDVRRNVRLTHSSVCTILDNADKIKESAMSETKIFV
jgi:hypothetical protein